jgi:hypothetical protein
MEPLTPEQILEMFRDFGLEREEDRARVSAPIVPDSGEGRPTPVFVRAASTTSSEGDSNAKLA